MNLPFLEAFMTTWKYHHPLSVEQLKYAGSLATVKKVGYYHGGDVLYELTGVPGLWHEACLCSVFRYSNRPLPPYSYVPGLAPHPMSDPRGHSFGVAAPAVRPLDESSYAANESYLYAIDLFNHGFYWEAHEEWESLWHAAGRSGPTADFLKGLIKLAAAGVKLREGRAAGVKQHAQRSAELISLVASSLNKHIIFGLNADGIHSFALKIAANSSELAGNAQPDANRSLEFTLQLETQ